MGKQKIEIKKIEAKDARRVCFSNRKSAIFSEANALATLCGAKVAILIESPAGCPFTFGSPSVGHVMDLFLRGGMGSTYTDACEAQRLSKVQQVNNNLMEVCSKIQEVKKKKAMLMSRIAELSAKNEDIRRIESAENLNLVELKKIKELLESFKESIKTKMLEDKTANSGIPCSTAQNLSGNGICQASSSVSSAAMTMFPENGLRVDNAGPSHGKGKVFSAAMTMFLEHGLRVDNAGPSHGKGKVSSAAMTMFPKHGLRVDNAGPSHGKGKGLDMNLNLFEDESYDHVEHMNPFVTPNASDADPSEPHRVPEDNKGLDMNLNLFEDGSYDHIDHMNASDLGQSEPDCVPDDVKGTFAAEKESK